MDKSSGKAWHPDVFQQRRLLEVIFNDDDSRDKDYSPSDEEDDVEDEDSSEGGEITEENAIIEDVNGFLYMVIPHRLPHETLSTFSVIPFCI